MGDTIARGLAKKNMTIMTNCNKQLIYNKYIGLKNWKTALSTMEAGTGILNLNVIGTSIACGGVSTDYINKSWVGLLRKALATRFSDVGNGMIPTYQKTTGDIDMWTLAGTWTEENLFGLMSSAKSSTVLGSTATVSFSGTGVRIVTYQGAACGRFTATIDGGAPVEFNSNGATVAAVHWEVTGLADGNHTLVITQNEAGKLTLLLGIYALKGTKGVRVNANSKFGGAIANAVTNSNVLFAEIDYWSPSLTIIEFMTNDYFSQVPTATYKTNMQTLITRAKTFGDVLLLPNGIRRETNTIKQTDYLAALKDLAVTNNIAFMDTFDKWGGDYDYANGTLNYLYDTVHPNDAGHENIANWVVDTLFS